MKRAGSTTIDLRTLPETPPRKRERPEREDPDVHPVLLPGRAPEPAPPVQPELNAPAPAPSASFAGLDFTNWGNGHPPDTVGDVGPVYYIQAINTSIGIYRKSDGVRVAAFTFDTFMSQGNFGNLCDTDNFGDPVVLYDSFEDRWVITDFAFQVDGSGNVVNPPGAFQCFAVSKTGDPVSGGWNYYSINTAGGLGDYPKFGIWTDGLYMTTSMFDYAASGSFQNPRVYAFNKAQMYAGSPTVQVVSFDAPTEDFTILPSNARLQTGTPPPGSPNYFVSTWEFLNGLTVYKFHVDWNSISLSTFTGPEVPLAATSWPNATVPNAPSQGGNSLDVLQIRAMMQNQYTNIGGAESLWTTHTVRRADTTGFAAPRWYQVNVTGGTVAANIPQAATWDPDGANVMYRFMPSLAVDRAGDMALGYSTSSSTTKPAIKYAGRLAGDAVNTFSQTEQVLIQGTGTQTGNCGGSACIRWGDYSAMSLDPNGCTFWYTNEYYVTDGLDHQTRIGSFAFPSCTPVGAGGTLSGTVTATVGGAPISGATVTLGSRTATTDGAGFYSFTGLPAGTYPGITASAPGYNSASFTSIAVTDGGTTTRDFSLATAPTSACPTDTTQADFQTGVPTNVDLTTSPGNVILLNGANLDQHADDNGFGSGYGFSSTSLIGQTFTPSVTGQLTRVDADLFCASCSGTNPNITLEVRTTSGGQPVMTAAGLLASATIAGTSSGSGGFFSFNYGTPPTLTAGTQYGIVIRLVANRTTGTQAWVSSSGTVYAGGRRVTCTTSACSNPVGSNSNSDLLFKTYMKTGFALSGDQVSPLKDSNPAVGFITNWTTLSWTASTPANTTLRFQVAASNSAFGPFNFVGPDGTAATFFTTSGASISQFNGFRYLKYKAYFTTTVTSATPTLNDVTVCYTTVLAAPPDLSLTKSDGGASVAPGGTVAYTLTYTNSGGQTAAGTVITETVPANTTFNAGASTAGWSCTPNNNAGSTCTLSVGGVVAGGGGSATFTVTVVNPVAAGVTQISNTASIADNGVHGADPTPGNNSASDTTPVIATPDLALTKSDGGASVAPGATVAYTLTYANSGNQGATGVVLTETVPANSIFNAGASTAGWSCSPNNNAGSTCTLTIGGVAGSGGGSATFAVTVADPLPAGVTQISNTASVADDNANGTDPTPGNNSASDTTPIAGAPDLSITKSDGGASVAPGGTVSYTLSYANGGNRGATGVTISDTVPANTTFNAGASTAGWSCSPNNNAGSTCTLTVGSLAASANGSATFAVTVADPVPAGATQISNTASIADDGTNGTDPNAGNNSGSDTTPVTGAPDLSITKSDGGVSATPGGTVSYTLSYANGGNRGASGVVITETVPANATFNAGASTAGWVCAPNNNAGSTCTLTVGSLAGGVNSSATFAVTVVDPVAAGVTQISNTASIADDNANGTDPTPGNNSGSDTTPVNAAPDLSLTKSDGGASVAPGSTVAYTLTYANDGDQGATGVVLSETVPANTTFNAGASTAGWSCSPNSNAGSTCTLTVGALTAGGGNQTATFAVTADDPLPAGVSQISNTAIIADDGANGTDPTPGNNSGSDTTPIAGAPDLSITKSDGGASVAPGGTASYTLTYANGGNRGATGVVITETVPANTTFNAGASTAGWSCAPSNNAGSTCTLTVGSLAASANGSATFAVTVTDPLPAGVSQISNTASIADDGANGTDPTPGNNSGSDTTPVTGAPDFSITKSDGGASVAPGGTVSYTLTYANGGNRGATGVVITETVPANTTFNAGASTAGWACTPNGNAGSTCTLTIGALAAGSGNQTATFAVTAADPVPAGVTQISNTASIADDNANGTDPTPGNNSGSDTTPVTGAPDLSITKSDGGASTTPGSTVSYTLTYANGGNRGASGVVITETVPANTTFNAGASTAGWACTPNGNAGATCTLAIGSLAAGSGNQTATFAVTVANPLPAGVTQISNTASIDDDHANGTDPNVGNNSGSDTTPLTAAPDLSIAKSDGGVSVAPGGTVSYTLTYANNGSTGATGVVLTETVPANTAFNVGASTAGWSCTPSNNSGSTCTLAVGALAAGGGNQTATFAVVLVNPVAAGVTQVSNTASIADDGANGTDPTPGDNSATDTTPVTAAPDLSITKSDGGSSVVPGSTATYTLTYANGGNQGATGVVLTETVPANTTFNAGASTAGWSCTPSNNAGSTCTLTIGALAAGGGNQTATFAVTVDNPLPASVTQITNTASIADDGTNGTDPTPANNSATDTTPAVAGNYYTVTPCRIVDTRNANGPTGGPALVGGTVRSFPIAGICGIPADASSVTINITVVGPTAAGDLRLFPSGITPPTVSTINFSAGQTRANNAVMSLTGATPGSIDVQTDMAGSGTTHFLLDVTGYFK